MAFLFQKRKTPVEAMKSLLKYLTLIEEGKSSSDAEVGQRTAAKLIENIDTMKYWLFGDGDGSGGSSSGGHGGGSSVNAVQAAIDHLAAPTTKSAQHTDEMVEQLFDGVNFSILIQHMQHFEFESRRDVVAMFVFAARIAKDRTVSWITTHQNFITLLIEGYTATETALHCGAILREIARHEDLCALVLQPTFTTAHGQQVTAHSVMIKQDTTQPLPFPHMERLFGFVQFPVFDIAQDAFSTLKALLTKHTKLVAKFLETCFTDFFNKYNQLLLGSDNYVTKRLGLKLLAELLLARPNFNVMMQYISDPAYLRLIMTLLRNPMRSIQIESRHIFKIFVANPRKSDAIQTILYRNKDKLVEFLQNFNNDKADEQFNEEQTILISTLIHLEPPRQQ